MEFFHSSLLQLFPFLLSLSSNYAYSSFRKLLETISYVQCHVNTHCDTGDGQNVTVSMLITVLLTSLS